MGYWQIEIRRELDPDELAFISQRYSDLEDTARAELIRQLSFIHTGEMVPFYIMRYGFYEGHTDYRADPITAASLFGLHTIRSIDRSFGADIQAALTCHHTRDDAPESSAD